MRVNAKIFFGLALFLGAMTVLYFVATARAVDGGNIQGVEWAGGTAMVLATLLCLFLAAYFQFTFNRMDIVPEDYEEAEVADGAGELGFFSASSIWPFAMAFAIMIMGYAIAFMQYWLILFGAVMLVWAGIMLQLQYLFGPEKH